MHKAGPRCPIPSESDSHRLEATPQFSKIVDLTIERQYIAVVGIHHRLMATGGEILNCRQD